MLEFLNDGEIFISSSVEYHDCHFHPQIYTAPLLACKQMKFDGVAHRIGLRIDTLCAMKSTEAVPADIRRCVRYFESKYDSDSRGKLEPPQDGWVQLQYSRTYQT